MMPDGIVKIHSKASRVLAREDASCNCMTWLLLRTSAILPTIATYILWGIMYARLLIKERSTKILRPIEKLIEKRKRRIHPQQSDVG